MMSKALYSLLAWLFLLPLSLAKEKDRIGIFNVPFT
jgi:hypothetical protein